MFDTWRIFQFLTMSGIFGAAGNILSFGNVGSPSDRDLIIASFWLLAIILLLFITGFGAAMLRKVGLEGMSQDNIAFNMGQWAADQQPRNVTISGFLSNADINKLASSQAFGK